MVPSGQMRLLPDAPVRIGGALQPFPLSKPGVRLSPHRAFRLLRAPRSEYPVTCRHSAHHLGDNHTVTYFCGMRPSAVSEAAVCPHPILKKRRHPPGFPPSEPGRPSPCPSHYRKAFGCCAASALSSAGWHFRLLFRHGGMRVPRLRYKICHSNPWLAAVRRMMWEHRGRPSHLPV